MIPLAMAMIAGPGTMVTVIVNTHRHSGIWANVEMSGVCVALAIAAGMFAAGAKGLLPGLAG